MTKLLLISDNLSRTERLISGFGAIWDCLICDLYDECSLSNTPELIVSDVKVLNSEAFLRLRQLLERVRAKGVPYLCLLHDSSARTRVQFDLLNPSGKARGSEAMRLLVNNLAGFQSQTEPYNFSLQEHADTAQHFLREVLVPGAAVTPQLADVGTEIVASAVREVGIRAWVRTIRRFDDATHQHCLLVAGLASAFSTTLGFSATDCHRLTRAALLHDVGKIHIPTTILNKQGKLNVTETAIMRTHPEQGHAMLVNRGFEDAFLTVIRSHHEMLDGSGYPDKLKGCDVPDLVRLVTVCDIYGALIEHRPYRAPMPGRQAYAILESMTGKLDRTLVCAFRPIADICPPPVTTR